MTVELSPHAPEILRDYYRILTSGPAGFQGGATLRPLLSDHLDFTGPIAGHRPDSTEGFLHGVSGFVETVGRVEVHQDVHDDAGSAVRYTATMPGGPVAFAEFFTIVDGRIASIALNFDGPQYVAKGGR